MNTRKLLIDSLNELDITCSDKQTDAFMIYLSELKKWNRAYNLTAIKSDEDIIIKHFVDSLLFVKVMPETHLQIADVGTGAGFPGIPVKIIRPETEITLIDSSRKKTAFLRHLTRQLELKGINVVQQRIENLDSSYNKKFDSILSRATFSVKEFLATACPYIRNGGNLILNKGPKITKELMELDKFPDEKRCIKDILNLQLPHLKADRSLVVLECIKRS
jgi:16S rRNA (guanine527-N7)-methyltransferase